MKNIQRIREQFPVTNRKTFLNHAGVSPLPKTALEAIQIHLEKRVLQSTEPDFELDESRKLFAELVNAESEEIALVPNTSTGLSIVANLLEYPRGCNIVTTDLEFPSVTYPWLRKQMRTRVEVRYVRNIDGELRVEDFKGAINNQTIAVAVSHVEYSNGFRNDIKAIAEASHSHGAFLIVDACQSAGALNIDVKSEGVDFLATSCYKWLLGPCGAGFLYVSKEITENTDPVLVGWASVKQEVFDTIELWDNRRLRLSEAANRFETGTPSILSYVGATSSLKLILETGKDRVERRVTGLTGFILERLREEDFKLQTIDEPEHRSGIVNFIVDNPREKAKKLCRKGIIVSPRMNGIRISPHFYNTEEELEKLITELKKL